MTVVLIAHYAGPRLGIGQYLNRLIPPLIEEISQRGVDFIIFASPNAYHNTPALQSVDASVKIIPALDYPPLKRFLWFASKFAILCFQHQIKSVIWLSNPVIFPWHPKSIAVIHDVNEWKEKNKYGSLIKTAMRSIIYLDMSILVASEIIAISHATRQDLLKFRPHLRKSEKIKVILNGANSALVDYPSTQIQSPTAPFLLSVGRIDPDAKKLREAVALTKALRNISNKPWELHLIGGMNASTEDAGKAFLQEIKSINWVQYQGYVPDIELAQWYRQAQAVIFLSDNEGFGFPIAEACSFERWAIVSHLNYVSIEAGGENIIPIDYLDLKEAAQQINRILSLTPNPNMRGTEHTWDKAANAYAQIIEYNAESSSTFKKTN